jgi:hypothetical protein
MNFRLPHRVPERGADGNPPPAIGWKGHDRPAGRNAAGPIGIPQAAMALFCAVLIFGNKLLFQNSFFNEAC